MQPYEKQNGEPEPGCVGWRCIKCYSFNPSRAKYCWKCGKKQKDGFRVFGVGDGRKVVEKTGA